MDSIRTTTEIPVSDVIAALGVWCFAAQTYLDKSPKLTPYDREHMADYQRVLGTVEGLTEKIFATLNTV